MIFNSLKITIIIVASAVLGAIACILYLIYQHFSKNDTNGINEVNSMNYMKTKDIDSNINTNAEKLEKQSNNNSVEHLKHIKAFDKLKSAAKLHQDILKEIVEYKTKKRIV